MSPGARRRAGPRSLPQAAVTMIAPLAEGETADGVARRLDALAPDAAGWFEPLDHVHFARWVVVPPRGDAPAFLAYEANVDGEPGTHLAALAGRLGPLCDRIWGAARGYPATPDAAAREAFLRAVLVPHAALHVGHPGLDLATIRNDLEVRRALGELLDEDDARGGALRRLPLREAHAEVIERLRHRRPDLWLGRIEDGVARRGIPKAVLAVLLAGAALGAQVGPGHLWVLEWLLGALVVGLALVAIVGAALAILRVVLPRVVDREEEAAPAADALRAPERQDPEMERILTSERAPGQNALTHLSFPRPSAFRRGLARLVFFVIELVARLVYVEGALGDITSIHFARWMWIDGGRQLLFFSNYDGTWESYLGEFTDKQATWLSAVWSNTEGFPPTEGLFRPTSGAGKEDLFKRWTRHHELRTQLWYAAYPDRTVKAVLDDAKIRAALRGDARAREIRWWMEKA